MTRETTIAGRRVRYADVGAGRPLVLLHAFPLDHRLWRHQLAAPAPGWRYVAPDLRGFGESERLPADASRHTAGVRSMVDYADDVIALIELLELERPALAGVSLGGYVAFAMVARLGQRLSGLVLSDTRSEGDTDEARRNRRRMQETVLEKGPGAVADEMVPRLLGETSRRERPELDGEVRGLIEGNSAQAIHDALEALASRPDSTSMLGTIKCPTLVTVGAEDQLTPVALHKAMHDAISGSRLEVIPAAGHLANLEAPDGYNDALSEFLDFVAEA